VPAFAKVCLGTRKTSGAGTPGAPQQGEQVLSADSHNAGHGRPAGTAGSRSGAATTGQPGRTGWRRWRMTALAGAATAVVIGVVAAFALNGDGGTPDPENRADTGGLGTGTPAASEVPGGTGQLGAAPPASASAKPSPTKPAGAPPARSSNWPGPDTTGVPAGTKLSAYRSSMQITKANTTIDGKTINGCVQISARNVTIKRSKITCGGDLIVKVSDNGSVTLEDTELDGQGTAMAIGYGNYTLRRVDIYNINEGPRVSSNAVIVDSWIHGLVRRPGDHHDILQTTGGTHMVVRHNNLEAYDPQTKDPFNAAFQLGAETDDLNDLVVEDNLMNGGNYTVNIRDDPGISGVVFRNNTFAGNARYGPVTGQDTQGVTWASSNVTLDGGKPVA
jgi:hypothetical protein